MNKSMAKKEQKIRLNCRANAIVGKVKGPAASAAGPVVFTSFYAVLPKSGTKDTCNRIIDLFPARRLL